MLSNAQASSFFVSFAQANQDECPISKASGAAPAIADLAALLAWILAIFL